MNRFSLLLLSLLISSSLFAQTGILSGYIKDKQTQMPISAASIQIEGANLGAISDENGLFSIKDLPTKTYNIKVTCIGYEAQVIYNIVIASGNSEVLTVELLSNSKNLAEVLIKKNPFRKNAETPLSIQSLSAQEIKSNPGGNFDVSRVIQAFPGVSGTAGSVGGYRNDIIIRGGAPNENVYYLDGIEMPSINHFATQGSGGGPTGILNISFIEDVTLYTGAFPAKYDNPLSGILQLKQRKANTQKLDQNFRLGASEAAYTIDGPISKKVSFMASARRSYLQILFQLLKLPIQPSYWDFQYKVDVKLSNKLSFYTLAVGAIDHFTFLNPGTLSPENLFILKTNPFIDQWSYTNGYGLKKSINKGYWNLTFSRNRLQNEYNKYEDNQNPSEANRNLKIVSKEAETKLRFEYNKFINQFSYSFGTMLQYVSFENSVFAKIDSSRKIQSASAMQFWKYGAFGQAALNMLDNRLSVSLGARIDGNSFTNAGLQFSPRLSASYVLMPQLKFNTAIGSYYKLPSNTVLGYKDANHNFANLVPYIQCNHLVAGLEYLPAIATRFTLEAFDKQYSNYPISQIDGISLANKGGDFSVLGNEPVVANGQGKSRGIEFQFQQKLVKNYFVVLSYTYYKTMFTNLNGSYYAASWDNRHLISFIGGLKLKNNLELGLKFRYQGGAPFTPLDTLASRSVYAKTGNSVYDNTKFNQFRLDPFYACDFRIDKKWNYKKWSLDLFMDITNLFASMQTQIPTYTFARNTDNTAFLTSDGLALKEDGSNGIYYATPKQKASTIPTIGFILAF